MEPQDPLSGSALEGMCRETRRAIAPAATGQNAPNVQDNAAEESGETYLYRCALTESRLNCQRGKSDAAPVEESQSVEPCDSI